MIRRDQESFLTVALFLALFLPVVALGNFRPSGSTDKPKEVRIKEDFGFSEADVNLSKRYRGFSALGGLSDEDVNTYWFLLERKSNREYLYLGVPGDAQKSALVKTFAVKAGVPGEKPTPLPKLLGKDYWVLTDKVESKDNPETAPYFLMLDIPVLEEPPFGPVPYLECIDPSTGEPEQCDWILPGAFGLHGVNGDLSKLSLEDPGSSGCVRHSDEDITYLYNLLEPKQQEIRYYVNDS